MNNESVKSAALMLLANGVQAEVVTEDQVMNIMFAMDSASKGTPTELDARATAIAPIFTSLAKRYLEESK
jgi:hypothetical protein